MRRAILVLAVLALAGCQALYGTGEPIKIGMSRAEIEERRGIGRVTMISSEGYWVRYSRPYHDTLHVHYRHNGVADYWYK